MRESFAVVERAGTLRVPDVVFSRALDDEGDADVAYEHVTEALAGLLAWRTTWTVERGAAETRVMETVRVTRAWYLCVLAGVVAVLLGALASRLGGGTGALWLWALGVLGAMGGTSATVSGSRLPDGQVSVSRVRYPQLGPLAVVWLCVAGSLAVGGRVGVLCASAGCIVWAVHGWTRRVESVCAGVSAVGTAWLRTLPPVASRYVAVTAAASAGLVAFAVLNAAVTVRRPLVSCGVVVGGALLVAVLLGRQGSRRLVPLQVVTAAALTGLLVLSVPWHLAVTVRPLPATSLVDSGAVVASAVSVSGVWVAGWRWLFASNDATRRRFTTEGRTVSTRVAAVSAYAMITAAGTLLAVVLGSVVLGWRLTTAGAPPSVWLLGVSLALPTVYLVCGAGYQLARLAGMVWAVRRRCDRSGLSADAVPFEPAYPVWVLPREEFYAGAYWDPCAHAIVLSEGALDALDPAERAAVIAHEESHFEHRGAYLQFVLACLPTFALIGKNVVYSIYDFHARELTADERAVRRVDEAVPGADGADVLVGVLERFAREEWDVLEESAVTFLPTMQMGDSRAVAGLNRVFDFLFGYFAGGVHPSNEERIAAVRRLDRDDG
ncbi:M48 family metalloprotease (plasmid) [Halarchaeum sp. CBA1220]|uniref:M48 family metalloprotease n=1 Tax=Halarchaeum sp. CBA1220 TaxID=1853682 RepID=UPI000F3A89CE|nr:M48 family metalloprotease [Halarchaeum sp. CBA1220]QLC35120.1 M48 family metalloprotease [Halarchaeum sp. CBA1220]